MVYSVAGLLGQRAMVRERPFRAPHHTVSVAGLAGGGPMVRPGEISLAHNGVLFLDELLEFSRPVLETLQATAGGTKHRHRARPADGQLPRFVPVGGAPRTRVRAGTWATRGGPAPAPSCASRPTGPGCRGRCSTVSTCTCTCRRWPTGISAAREPGESSASVRARVESAHTRQRARDPRSNATLPARALAEVVQLDTEADRLLERAVERLALSARAIDCVRRVARTIADLEGSAGVGAGHLAEALQYRLLDRPDP